MKLKKGFTLIEMMIAITLVTIISMAAYAPYGYYKKRVKLKNAASIITQTLYDSRNKAINGAVGINGNVSIGVLFDHIDKNKISIFSYPYDIDINHVLYSETSEIKLIKTIFLPKGIQIDSIEGGDNLLLMFDSISGSIKYFKRIAGGGIGEVTGSIYDEIEINFSYMGSTSVNLQKSILYFSTTNIIDY